MPNLETQSVYNLENKESISDISNKSKEFLESVDKKPEEAKKLVDDLKSDSSLSSKMESMKAKESNGKLPNADTLLNQYDSLNKNIVEGANIIDKSEYRPKDIVSKMLDTATKTGYTDLKITNVSTDTNGTILSV
jgi:hypothetical protein